MRCGEHAQRGACGVGTIPWSALKVWAERGRSLEQLRGYRTARRGRLGRRRPAGAATARTATSPNHHAEHLLVSELRLHRRRRVRRQGWAGCLSENLINACMMGLLLSQCWPFHACQFLRYRCRNCLLQIHGDQIPSSQKFVLSGRTQNYNLK